MNHSSGVEEKPISEASTDSRYATAPCSAATFSDQSRRQQLRVWRSSHQVRSPGIRWAAAAAHPTDLSASSAIRYESAAACQPYRYAQSTVSTPSATGVLQPRGVGWPCGQ